MVLIGLSACVRQTTYPPYPIITFQSNSKNVLNLSPSTGYLRDSVNVTIAFTDGEGGIGPSSGVIIPSSQPCTDHAYDSVIIANPNNNVFFYTYHAPSISTDSCLSAVTTAYVPDNPKYVSISGTIQFSQTNECPPVGNSDTIILSVFIKDRSGKISNRVRTTPLIINCN
jgi:hypothetical protein